MMTGSNTDAVLYWNDIALQTVSADHSSSSLKEQFGPTRTSRALAIVSVAMYDAINSVLGQYEPYLIKVVGVQNANIDAAVGEAAHDTLVALYKKQKTTIDADLSTWLGQITDGHGENMGIALGKTVAKAVIADRLHDGSNAKSNYKIVDAIGKWTPDPVTQEISDITQKPLDPQWGKVTPFGINSTAAYLPPPPPAIDSPEYTATYNELKDLGGDGITTPTTRTADQTEIGIFWAYDGTEGLCAPPRLYNQIARVIAVQQGNSEYQNARMFAMMNVAMADAAIVGWDGKYIYDMWRPVTAIRDGNNDGNPDTVGDPTWTPLGAPASNETLPNNFTPPFPSYPSGHAIIGAAVFHTLADFYGTDNISFSFTSDEFNGVTTDNQGNVRPEITRNFTSFSQASEENAESRIYLGIHWDFDLTAGINSGNRIANFIFKQKFDPLNHAMPSGSGNMFVPYVQTLVQMTLMDLADHSHRQTVMLKATDTPQNTVYTVSAFQPLFPTPGQRTDWIFNQVIYTAPKHAAVQMLALNPQLIDNLLADA
jgi:PAP2 superfamily/Vanadium chloroperoxidase N-terminal domain